MTDVRRNKAMKNTTVIKQRRVITHGRVKSHPLKDFYHLCLTAGWFRFFVVSALIFIGLNIVFAALYMLDAEGIANLSPIGILGTFFFSVETLATVGYGDMHPASTYAHLIATVEMFVGLVGTAMMTGLVFARFSKPRSRIMFAKSPVITVLNGQPALMIRTGNARQNYIVGASAKLYVLQNEVTQEGIWFRRVYDLNLVRVDQPMFFLGWTLIHVIDESSPLFGKTADDFEVLDMGLVLNMQGMDESTAQLMQARQVYGYENIKWQHNYVDAIYTDADGAAHIDYAAFHETEAI